MFTLVWKADGKANKKIRLHIIAMAVEREMCGFLVSYCGFLAREIGRLVMWIRHRYDLRAINGIVVSKEANFRYKIRGKIPNSITKKQKRPQ